MKIREKVTELLKAAWYSNYELQMLCKSSSADREARNVRKYPPEGYEFIQRPKYIDGYRRCLEFHLKVVD